MLLAHGGCACAQSSEWSRLTDEALAAYEKGNFESAEQLLGKALTLAEESKGDDSRLIKSLDNLSLIYFKEGDYARTEPLLMRALSMREKKYGESSIKIAEGLHNLGLLYMAEDKYKGAKSTFKLLCIRQC